MPNITLSMDEKLIEAGRRYAHAHGKTLNGLVRDLLTKTVASPAKDSLDDLFRLIDENKGDSKGWKWNRDELYDV